MTSRPTIAGLPRWHFADPTVDTSGRRREVWIAERRPPNRTLTDFQAETDRMIATLEPEDQAWLIAVLEAEEEPARTSRIE